VRVLASQGDTGFVEGVEDVDFFDRHHSFSIVAFSITSHYPTTRRKSRTVRLTSSVVARIA
jgi:hypothetical protein